MKAILNNDGTPAAFYSPEIHGDKIPAGAVDITERQWQECINSPGRCRLSVDPEGTVTVEEYTPPPALDAERREERKTAIDQAAGNARARFVSPGDLIDQEYLAAEQAAEKFKAAGYPGDAVPAEIQTWADATGWTPQQAADDIIATGTTWRQVLAAIRGIRLAGKAAVDVATGDAIEVTAAQYIAQLDGMAPA